MIAKPTFAASSDRGVVSTADVAATRAGIGVLADGGNAVDAAIAANAAIGVVAPHQCGMGGDLFALVHANGVTHALNASGRAGSGVDPERLRAAGCVEMPLRHDVNAVTVPGCVDGWAALHDRFGTLPLDRLLAPAIELAERGFSVSPLLRAAVDRLDAAGRANLSDLQQVSGGAEVITRAGAGAALRAVARGGRDAFYTGPFGAGLIELGRGVFTDSDLARAQAEWVAPISAEVFGVDLHTIPPNSQGYLTLGACRLAEQVGLPDDPEAADWAHMLIECATAAGFDRPDRLFDGADGSQLLAAVTSRAALIDPTRASDRWAPGRSGDTTYLCAVDSAGTGVSLIQSNAAGLGSWLAEPNTGINLHNRGLGFSLVAGHPAELQPGKRPPHTLSPALASTGDRLAAVLGTMGGDAQPQILLQLAARLFRHREPPSEAIAAGRWVLSGPVTGFDTWTSGGAPAVAVEGNAPGSWADQLGRRGHRVLRLPAHDGSFGHAHAIVVDGSGSAAGAADPRTVVGACLAP